MNSGDIQRALSGDVYTAPLFAGVYPYDAMVRAFTCSDDATKVYVFNTHPSRKPGEHWIALVVKGRIVYYFDSFGRHPDVYPALAKKIRRESVKVFYNSCLLQDLSSTACGDYCVIFCLLSSRGWSLQRVVNWMSSFDSSETRDHALRQILIDAYGPDFHSSYRQNRSGLVGGHKLHNVLALRAVGRKCVYDQ